MQLHGQAGKRDGYAMAALLVGLAVMAILLSVAMPTWRQMVQREKEAGADLPGAAVRPGHRPVPAKIRGHLPARRGHPRQAEVPAHEIQGPDGRRRRVPGALPGPADPGLAAGRPRGRRDRHRQRNPGGQRHSGRAHRAAGRRDRGREQEYRLHPSASTTAAPTTTSGSSSTPRRCPGQGSSARACAPGRAARR